MAKMAVDFCINMRDNKPALHSAADSFATTKLGLIAQQAVDQAIASGWTSDCLTAS